MSVWSGTGGSATQQAEAPCRSALPQLPHNTAACQLTEGAPSHVPIFWGIPRGVGCRHGLGAMSSQGLSTGRQWNRCLQGSQGGSWNLPSPAKQSPCSRALTKQEKGGFPTPGLPQWLQYPGQSQSSNTRLHQPGVCFAGWAGSWGCLQKVLGRDTGCGASDVLARPHQQHTSLPQEMFPSVSQGSGCSMRPQGRAGAKPACLENPKSDPVSWD